MPTRGAGGDSEKSKPRISMLRLSPDAPVECYSKQYLHADELPFFDQGPIAPNVVSLDDDSCAGSSRVGLAICFELGVPAHAAATFGAGAELYLASVAKHAAGMDAAEKTLTSEHRAPSASLLLSIGLVVTCCHLQNVESLCCCVVVLDLSRAYKAPTLLVNCIGKSDGDGMLCTGGSAVWDAAGHCIGRLPTDSAGILIYNESDGSTKAVLCEDSQRDTQQSL